MVKLNQIITILALAVAGNLSKKCSNTPGPTPTSIPEKPEIPLPSDGHSTANIYGLGYNAKHSDGQCPQPDKVVSDLQTIQKYTPRIRTFGLIDCNQGELIVQAAEKTGVQVLLGMFLNQNPGEFNNEFAKLKDLINRYRSTFEKHIPAIIVGSETLYRKELTFDQLAVYIKQVKEYVQVEAKLPQIQITTADTKDQWYPHATLDAVDFMLVNAYPYWENIPVQDAEEHLIQTINKVKGATSAANKRFVLGETGWPMGGPSMGPAVPSANNQLTYFNKVSCRLDKEGIDYYWFSAFDESWKTNETKADWGLLKEGGSIKQGYVLPRNC